jgi:hypothetical protein
VSVGPATGVSRALRAALAEGSVLAGRYRLTAALPAVEDDPDDAQRWEAVDDVLARPVRVVVLRGGGRRAAATGELLAAAATASTVVSPVLAQVYDAAVEQVPAERYGRPAGTVDVAYVVSERVDGPTLAQALAEDGPLDPEVATQLTVAAADALAATHARGVVHGLVCPRTVVLRRSGGLALADPVFGAALARRGGLGDAPPLAADHDVQGLTACLYAMLTGRWPEQATALPSGGLRPAPAAPGRDGRPCSPRQVRAGVPRALDAVVAQALGAASTPEPPVRRPAVERAVGAPARPTPAPLTADGLSTALRGALAADTAARAPSSPLPRRLPRLGRGARRALLVGGTAVGLVVVGSVAYSTGRELGTVKDDPTALEALVESTPSPVPGEGEAGSRLDLTAPGTAVIPFDPPPGDGPENTGAVPNAVDGDPATAWETERYDTSRFGGLKPGVGLLVDLGQPTAVEQVEVGLRAGGDVELRAADEAGPDAESFRVVATAEDTGPVARLVPTEPVTARWFLVWMTRLPEAGERFQGSIGELFFVRS